MKLLKKWMAIVLVVVMFASPAIALDVEGKLTAVPGFEDPAVQQVDTTRSIVTIRVVGSGLGLYPGEDGNPKYGYGGFGMEGSGVIVNNYIITAAHVVNPTQVAIRMPNNEFFTGPLVNVKEMQIFVGGMPARVFYKDIDNDIAILVFDGPLPLWIENIKIALRATIDYILTFFGVFPINQLHEGDMIFTIVRVRDAEGVRGQMSEIHVGKVVHEDAMVPPGYEDALPWFSLNDFTAELEILPGDSGSPVFGFDNGVPVLIGIARARGLGLTYVARIDIIKLIVEATF